MSTDKLAGIIRSWDNGGSARTYRAAADRVREAFVVIDRDAMHKVTRGDEEHVVVGVNDRYRIVGLTPGMLRDYAARHLAVAEWMEANPPVDEKAVEELALDLVDRPGAQITHAMAQVIARRLVADGWKREVAD